MSLLGENLNLLSRLNVLRDRQALSSHGTTFLAYDRLLCQVTSLVNR